MNFSEPVAFPTKIISEEINKNSGVELLAVKPGLGRVGALGGMGGTGGADGRVRWVGGQRKKDCPHTRRYKMEGLRLRYSLNGKLPINHLDFSDRNPKFDFQSTFSSICILLT